MFANEFAKSVKFSRFRESASDPAKFAKSYLKSWQKMVCFVVPFLKIGFACFASFNKQRKTQIWEFE